MKLKRFVSSDPIKAMREIKAVYGKDAVIISSRTTDDGVEIVAGAGKETSINDNQLTSSSYGLDRYERFKANNISKFQSDDSVLSKQVQYLTELVETEIASLAWKNYYYEHPIEMILLKRLIKLGFDLDYSCKLINNLSEKNDINQAWHTLISNILNNIRFEPNFFDNHKGIYTFIGATGVGKTTTIAKIAARYSFLFSPDSICLILTDTSRIGATEQLMIYAKILNINIAIAQTNSDLSECIKKFSDKSLVLIDMSGLGKNKVEVENQYNFIENSTKLSFSSILVLSANHDIKFNKDVIKRASIFSPVGCIISKIDECMQSGGLISSTSLSKLKMLYLTTGQSVPEDLITADKRSILDLMIENKSLNQSYVEDDDRNFVFSSDRIKDYENE